jgi:hypothetical protein
MMRVNWVFAEGYQLDPAVDADAVKSVGPTWGSWRTWRGCGTDNVICHDRAKAQELIKRAFQAVCNFYIPKKHYQDVGRPTGVKLYEGDFTQELDRIEDIIAMHLVSGISDIVLLVGFDFGPLPTVADQFEQHKLKNYHGLMRSTINSDQAVQWVAVDHPTELDKAYQNLSNLTCDSMESVLKLLL